MLLNGLSLIAFTSLFLPHRSEYINPEDCKIVFYYGPTYSDSESYPLAEAAAVTAHPKFDQDVTVVFIPDYHEPQLEEYQSHYTIDAYLRAGDVNMLFVDWGAPIASPDQLKDPYLPALVPMFTTWLREIHNSVDWDAFHVLAYAKGAEFIANVVKDLFRKTQWRIHRITQLAPPEEFIVDGKQVDNDKDLITNFIDAIHTNIGGQGTNFSRAHVDFYPNGGTQPQPGCSSEGLCSRRRSFQYYAESVNNRNSFCAYPVDSYEDYEAADKSELGVSIHMGRLSPFTARGNHYLDTNAEEPFSKGC